jgi:hypothetical protein
MEITGVIVNMLVDINLELYGPAVVLENRKKVLYVKVLKAIYGMLKAALFWYKTFRKDLEDLGFIFNLYDPCKICMIHAWPTRRSKDHNKQSYSMWTI